MGNAEYMGTHPIFESDFDCLTDLKLVRNGKGTTKVQGRQGESRRRRWKEVPNYKVITPSIVSDRMKIRGSLARRAIKELHGMGKIKLLVQHSSQMVYTRAIAVDDEEEEVVETKKKGKK